MKKILLISLSAIMLFCSCGGNSTKEYRPTHFPTQSSTQGYKIPFETHGNDVLVKIRLNGGTQFANAVWDLGCSVPLKISRYEIGNLMKDATFKSAAHVSNAIEVTVANGQTQTMDAYVLDVVSFTDNNGVEHSVSNVVAVVDPNMSTQILVGKPLMDALGYSQEIDNIEDVIIIRE